MNQTNSYFWLFTQFSWLTRCSCFSMYASDGHLDFVKYSVSLTCGMMTSSLNVVLRSVTTPTLQIPSQHNKQVYSTISVFIQESDRGDPTQQIVHQGVKEYHNVIYLIEEKKQIMREIEGKGLLLPFF